MAGWVTSLNNDDKDSLEDLLQGHFPNEGKIIKETGECANNLLIKRGT